MESWKKISIVLVVALFVFSSIGLSATKAYGWWNDNSSEVEDENPVVFVHGYFDKSSDLVGKSFFEDIKDYLEDEGWDSEDLFVIQYSNVIGCNIDNAGELEDFIIDTVMTETGSDEVDIVAHSMGGLSSRYYIQNMDGHANVGSIVTLGTPHDGTPLAYLAPGSGGDQMVASSDFLSDLNSGDITPGDVDYTSIYTYADEMVPWTRSRPEGWDHIGGWYNMHLTMLGHSSVKEHVADNLTQD